MPERRPDGWVDDDPESIRECIGEETKEIR